jgi:hypothetical protein
MAMVESSSDASAAAAMTEPRIAARRQHQQPKKDRVEAMDAVLQTCDDPEVPAAAPVPRGFGGVLAGCESSLGSRVLRCGSMCSPRMFGMSRTTPPSDVP